MDLMNDSVGYQEFMQFSWLKDADQVFLTAYVSCLIITAVT